MLIRFLVYGAVGWCIEVIWTGFGSLLKKDFKLTATTSLWMFFIYGMALFMEPVCDLIINLPVALRGGVYVVCIYLIEYVTGGIMKKLDVIPWDYSGSRYSVQGVIRLDYAPAWFCAGLLFESLYHMLV